MRESVTAGWPPGLARNGLAAPVARAGLASDEDAVPRLAPVPMAEELLHYQSTAFADLWYHMAEAHSAGQQGCPPPYWAACWPGGIALARYLLDEPQAVAGRHVVDLGAGGGVAALAAAAAGAGPVEALDSDPQALASVTANAAANALHIRPRQADILATPLPADAVLLAGDLFYEAAIADALVPRLRAAVAAGATVLMGEPGRPHAPEEGPELAAYPMPDAATFLEATDNLVARVVSLPGAR